MASGGADGDNFHAGSASGGDVSVRDAAHALAGLGIESSNQLLAIDNVGTSTIGPVPQGRAKLYSVTRTCSNKPCAKIFDAGAAVGRKFCSAACMRNSRMNEDDPDTDAAGDHPVTLASRAAMRARAGTFVSVRTIVPVSWILVRVVNRVTRYSCTYYIAESDERRLAYLRVRDTPGLWRSARWWYHCCKW